MSAPSSPFFSQQLQSLRRTGRVLARLRNDESLPHFDKVGGQHQYIGSRAGRRAPESYRAVFWIATFWLLTFQKDTTALSTKESSKVIPVPEHPCLRHCLLSFFQQAKSLQGTGRVLARLRNDESRPHFNKVGGRMQ